MTSDDDGIYRDYSRDEPGAGSDERESLGDDLQPVSSPVCCMHLLSSQFSLQPLATWSLHHHRASIGFFIGPFKPGEQEDTLSTRRGLPPGFKGGYIPHWHHLNGFFYILPALCSPRQIVADVAIAGAGPIGLLAALALSTLAYVDHVAIFEAQPAARDTSKVMI
jgi:hypothetical protein